MIDKLHHYSMTGPASVYDEEALTALELAGRTAAKVNQCVDAVTQVGRDMETLTGHTIPQQFDDLEKDFKAEIDTYITNTDVNSIMRQGSLLFSNQTPTALRFDTVGLYIESTGYIYLTYGSKSYTISPFTVGYDHINVSRCALIYDLKDSAVKCIPLTEGTLENMHQIVMFIFLKTALASGAGVWPDLRGLYNVDGVAMTYSDGMQYAPWFMLNDKGIRFETKSDNPHMFLDSAIYVTWKDRPYTVGLGSYAYNPNKTRWLFVLDTITKEGRFIPKEDYGPQHAVLFQVQLNHITNPLAQTIPYTYIVDGYPYNRNGSGNSESVGGGSGETVAYVNANAVEEGDGTYGNPYMTLEAAISGGANVIYAQGTFHEALKVNGLSSFKLYGHWPSYVEGNNNPTRCIISGMDPAGTIQVATAEANHITNVATLVIEDVTFEDCYQDCLLLENVNNATVRRCVFKGAQYRDGLHCVNTNINLYNCEAYECTNDGFNFHDHGHSLVENCRGHNNTMDGVSHHDACTGTIRGGEWYSNGKAGIASPTYGALVDIYDAVCIGNQYGILIFTDSTANVANYRNVIVKGCKVINNTNKNIYASGGYKVEVVASCTSDSLEYGETENLWIFVGKVENYGSNDLAENGSKFVGYYVH